MSSRDCIEITNELALGLMIASAALDVSDRLRVMRAPVSAGTDRIG